jgi:hypothetical protein
MCAIDTMKRVLLVDFYRLVKTQVKFDRQPSPMVRLDQWRTMKHDDIDRQYHRQVNELKGHDESITCLMSIVSDLIQQGDASIE